MGWRASPELSGPPQVRILSPPQSANHTCMKNKIKSQTEICREMTALRKSYGVSQEDVAREAGYSQTHLAYLETGQRRWRDDLVKIYTEAIRRARVSRKNRQMDRLMEKLARLEAA